MLLRSIKVKRGSRHDTAEINPPRKLKVADLTPGLTQWVKDQALL